MIRDDDDFVQVLEAQPRWQSVLPEAEAEADSGILNALQVFVITRSSTRSRCSL
jgi:hypothetical protein